MLFILEPVLEKRRAKIDEWNAKADAWVEEMNGRYGDSYNRNKYASRFGGRPYVSFKTICAVVLPILGGLAVSSLTVLAIVTEPPKKIDPNNPHSCTTVVKKGDKIGIVSDSFDGSKATVLDQKDDCSVDLTLDHSAYTPDNCKDKDWRNCDISKKDGEVMNLSGDTKIIKL